MPWGNYREQAGRIDASEASDATKTLAQEMYHTARRLLGEDLSVFWDRDDDEISFESDRGTITVGGSA